MQDEFAQVGYGIQFEPSSMFKEFAEEVLVFDTERDLKIYLDDTFMECNNIDDSNNLSFYIDWDKAHRDLLYDYEKVDMGSKIYLWRQI